jgi:LacI family transcriptional regulator
MFAADCPAIADGHAHRAAGAPCPVVGLSGDYSEQADYVAFDVACGVRQAVEHLVSIGCRRIAHLTTMSAIGRVRAARCGTYEEVVQSAGLAPEIILAPEESRAAARTTIKAYYQSRGTPDGLFCYSDDMAIGAYRGLRDLGLRIPEDVALVGCDGMDDVQYLDVPLTTIMQPVQEMCRLAWEVLVRRIEDPSASLSQTLLKPELRIDASTRR